MSETYNFSYGLFLGFVLGLCVCGLVVLLAYLI